MHTKNIVNKEIERTKQKDKGVDGHDGKYAFFNEPDPGSVHQETSKAPLHLNTIYNSDIFSTVLHLAIQYCTELIDAVYVLLQCVCK